MLAACSALGVSRATLYRSTYPAPPPTVRQRAPSPRRLGDNERQAIVDVMHSDEFVDQPPTEVFAKLLSCGVYLASIRTFYRVLAELGESKERRNQRLPHAYVKPSLTATSPNQVWTWDITKLATVQKGIFLHAYVIIDLFSRYVVGWMVAAKECQHLAAQLFTDTVARHGIEPGLTVHSDRGGAMKSDTLAQLLATLGVGQSFSRPHVSDDNPFSEAQCVFRHIRSAIPETSDHSFRRIRSESERRDELGSWSGGRLGIGLGFETFLAAHGGAAQGQDMGVVDEPVADGVGDSRIPEGFVPTFRRQLRGDDGRSFAVPIFEDLEQVATFGVCEGCE